MKATAQLLLLAEKSLNVLSQVYKRRPRITSALMFLGPLLIVFLAATTLNYLRYSVLDFNDRTINIFEPLYSFTLIVLGVGLAPGFFIGLVLSYRHLKGTNSLSRRTGDERESSAIEENLRWIDVVLKWTTKLRR